MPKCLTRHSRKLSQTSCRVGAPLLTLCQKETIQHNICVSVQLTCGLLLADVEKWWKQEKQWVEVEHAAKEMGQVDTQMTRCHAFQAVGSPHVLVTENVVNF